MASDILSIGRSGLFAAQVGLSTAGHNIANANVPGYSRQAIVQASSLALDFGYGFVGTGTQIDSIKRYSDDFLSSQVRSAQSSKSALDGYFEQISQVDNLLADTTSGLSPALQDFFKGVQDVSSNPASVASRQALLSTADSLAARFQALSGRMEEIRTGVNDRITSNVVLVNSYAKQIASLNEQIGAFSNDPNNLPNDLLDKRDAVVAELNKQVKAAVLPGDNNSYTISIGSGQPLVVGKQAFQLAAVASPTDQARVEVGYLTGDKVTVLAENALSGGELGGLFDFRANSLDRAENSLGRVAVSLAVSFNAQHKLGVDQSGVLGGDFFRQPSVFIGRDYNNSPISTTAVGAKIVDPSQLTVSDYRLQFNGANFVVTRIDDGKQTLISPFPQAKAQTIDGIDFTVTGSAVNNDNFIIRPTINGASDFAVALQDRNKIAAGAPIVTNAPITNAGDAKISDGVLDAAYLQPGNALNAPVTIGYDGNTNTLSGFGKSVKVVDNGVTSNFAPGVAVPFVEGATYTFGGISISFTGVPANGDSFGVSPNINGVGDNRNARLLGALQTAPILDGKTATFQSGYAELVSYIGNKTREVQVNGAAGQALLDQSQRAQQDIAGVNLDEEATALLKYQQAYQAAGKVIKLASDLFQTLLSIGG